MFKKIVQCSTLLLTLLLFVVACEQQRPEHEGLESNAANLWVSGYYVGYINYPVSEIDFSGLTHLMIGPVLPKRDATLEVSMYTANGPQLARQAVQAAHAKGKKAIAFVGGMDTGPQWAAASTGANRTKFVANLKKLMTDYGFDGLDLDWEPVTAKDKPLILALVKDLRRALPNAILTFPAVGTLNTNFPEDLSLYAQIAPYLNQLNLMTYDMTGAYPDGSPYEGWLSWHHAPLYNPRTGEYWRTPSSIDDTVKAYKAAGVPPHKLGIGIGFYGTCWSGSVTAPRQEFGNSRRVAGDNIISYNNIVRFYDLPEAWRWDSGAAVPYMSFSKPTGPDGCTFISFDNQGSIKAKGAYVKAHGLGGTIVWNINEGYVPSRPQGQRNPLLVATRQGFLE